MNGMRYRFTSSEAEAAAIDEQDEKPETALNELTYQWLSLQIVSKRDVQWAELTKHTTTIQLDPLSLTITLLRPIVAALKEGPGRLNRPGHICEQPGSLPRYQGDCLKAELCVSLPSLPHSPSATGFPCS